MDIETAFFELEHFLDRIPYVRVLYLGKTAKALKMGGEFTAPLEIGFRACDLTREARKTIEEYLPKKEYADFGYIGEIAGVPVHIYIYKNKYTFIDNPDTVPWRGESYFIPNSWDEYWATRKTLE